MGRAGSPSWPWQGETAGGQQRSHRRLLSWLVCTFEQGSLMAAQTAVLALNPAAKEASRLKASFDKPPVAIRLIFVGIAVGSARHSARASVSATHLRSETAICRAHARDHLSLELREDLEAKGLPPSSSRQVGMRPSRELPEREQARRAWRRTWPPRWPEIAGADREAIVAAAGVLPRLHRAGDRPNAQLWRNRGHRQSDG